MSTTTAPHEAAHFRAEITIGVAALTLTLEGEFDLAGQPTFESAMAVISDHAPGAVVLDLTNLHFIDSTGIAGLIALITLQRGRAQALQARGAHGQVVKLLHLVGIADRLPGIAPDTGAT